MLARTKPQATAVTGTGKALQRPKIGDKWVRTVIATDSNGVSSVVDKVFTVLQFDEATSRVRLAEGIPAEFPASSMMALFPVTSWPPKAPAVAYPTKAMAHEVFERQQNEVIAELQLELATRYEELKLFKQHANT